MLKERVVVALPLRQQTGVQELMAPVVVLVVVGLFAEAVAHPAAAEEEDVVHLPLWLGAAFARAGWGGMQGGGRNPRARGNYL